MLIKFKQNNARIITSSVKWTGTPVPNSGSLSELYINNKLSDAEMLKLFNTYDKKGEGQVLILFGGIPEEHHLLAFNTYSEWFDATVLRYINYKEGVDVELWGYKVDKSTGEVISSGWDEDYTDSPIKLTFDPAISLNAEYEGHTFGEFNAELVSLVSTTPFTQDGSDESYHLSGDYDGSEISIASKLNSGTPVPNDGSFVEHLYFNTDLSMEKVDAILDTFLFPKNVSANKKCVSINFTVISEMNSFILK